MDKNIRNVMIIGSGPAALTAAIYAARASLSPLVFAGVKWGGQLMLTTDVENYPGFPEGILGPALMEKFRQQAERFGAEIIADDVTAVNFKTGPFKVIVGAKTYQSKSVIIATGAETKWLGLASEQRLIGKGVSSCAPCDAFFFKDKKVIVVGGGDSAMEEALVLTKFATDVAIVHRRDEFRASKIMLDRAQKNKKISLILNSVVVDVLGEGKVEGVKIKNNADNSVREMPIDGIFVAIGHLPNTDVFQGQMELDEKGYVVRNLRTHLGGGAKPMSGEHLGGVGSPVKFQMMTSVEGIFVAGD